MSTTLEATFGTNAREAPREHSPRRFFEANRSSQKGAMVPRKAWRGRRASVSVEK
jgi:hypothetical protein